MSNSSTDAVLAAMPASVRSAVEQRDGAALDAALHALPEAEQAAIIAALEQAGILQIQTRSDLLEVLPASVRQALETQSVGALENALSALSEEDREATLVVLRQIDALLQVDITPEELVLQLPLTLQEALARQDSDAFKAAFEGLEAAAQERAAAIIQRLQELLNAPDMQPTPDQQAAFTLLPEAIQTAIVSSDQAAFHAALAALPEAEQQQTIQVLLDLGILQT